MGTTPFLGQIKCFAFPGVPHGWAACNGQLLSIQQNTALFSLLGTTYGGNGTTNFALPDLRGRLPIHRGQGPGLTNRVQGSQVGTENVTLATTNIPSHTHTISACPREGDSVSPAGCYPAKSGRGDARYGAVGQAGQGTMSSSAMGIAGSSLPHSNMMPYLCMNYCIALQGIFPSQP